VSEVKKITIPVIKAKIYAPETTEAFDQLAKLPYENEMTRPCGILYPMAREGKPVQTRLVNQYLFRHEHGVLIYNGLRQVPPPMKLQAAGLLAHIVDDRDLKYLITKHLHDTTNHQDDIFQMNVYCVKGGLLANILEFTRYRTSQVGQNLIDNFIEDLELSHTVFVPEQASQHEILDALADLRPTIDDSLTYDIREAQEMGSLKEEDLEHLDTLEWEFGPVRQAEPFTI
jgi:hypothetical protein